MDVMRWFQGSDKEQLPARENDTEIVLLGLTLAAGLNYTLREAKIPVEARFTSIGSKKAGDNAFTKLVIVVHYTDPALLKNVISIGSEYLKRQDLADNIVFHFQFIKRKERRPVNSSPHDYIVETNFSRRREVA